MISGEHDVEIHALNEQGWSVAAIARHTDHDPKAIRGYLSGECVPGVRALGKPDEFEEFVAYVRARFAEDPHVWGTALFDEVVELGYAQSYQTFTRRVLPLESWRVAYCWLKPFMPDAVLPSGLRRVGA